jgi:hypothetical protein
VVPKKEVGPRLGCALSREQISCQHLLHLGDDPVAVFTCGLSVGILDEPLAGLAHDAQLEVEFGGVQLRPRLREAWLQRCN